MSRNQKTTCRGASNHRKSGRGGHRLSLPDHRIDRQPSEIHVPFIPHGVEQIKASSVWSSATGAAVHVAVIDTGLDYTHRDLRPSASFGYNVLQPHLPPFDDNGHGTHIAGTIAASNRRFGLTGVAPDAIIHPVKAFDDSGSATTQDIIRALEWAIEHKMDVINMSFGMRHHSKSFYQLIRKAHRAGIVIVASAGNDGKFRADYPARYPEVISVGAATMDWHKLPMSNRGRHIDLYAPGEKVISTWLHGQYQVLSGTSMAAAYVSGAAALLLSLEPKLTPSQIRELLTQYKTPTARRSGKAGVGVLNLLHAMNRLPRKGERHAVDRHIRSGADTPMRRRTLRKTVRTQSTSARRA